MADEIVIEPRSDTATVEPMTEAPETSELPDELLQIPALQGLFAGSPPAFSASLKEFEKRDEAKTIAKNKDALMGAGMGFYRTLDGARGVVFNTLYVSPDDIKAADQSGQLATVAPEFTQVNDQIATSGEANPVLQAQPPTGMANPPAPTNAPGAMPAPLPASAQKTLTNQRSKNLQVGAPTTGPEPGAGRLLNSLLKPVL